MTGRHPLTLLTTLALAACASASNPTGASRCALSSADSVFLRGGPVYRPCAVDRRAEVITSRQPDFRPDLSFKESCYSAEFEFVIDATGMPEVEEARQLHANDPNFATAALGALAEWRYKPAYLNGVPVRELTTQKFRLAAVLVAVPAGGTPRPPNRMPKC
jgi:hypothetical protein